jgi:hypothetical protein
MDWQGMDEREENLNVYLMQSLGLDERMPVCVVR